MKIALALFLLALPAYAEPVTVGPTACAKVRKQDPKARCKDLALDGDEIDGAIAKGEGDVIGGRQQVKWGSLIRLRVSMMDKLVKSAENVAR